MIMDLRSPSHFRRVASSSLGIRASFSALSYILHMSVEVARTSSIQHIHQHPAYYMRYAKSAKPD